MPLDFPSNPSNGQVYNNFYYDSTTQAWRSIGSVYAPNYLKNPTFTTVSPYAIPLTVQGVSSQAASLQEWKNSSGTVLSSISDSGALFVPSLTSTGSISGAQIIGTTPSNSGSAGGMTVRAPSSGTQTSAYLQFVNNSNSTEYATISASPTSVVTITGRVTMPQQPAYSGSLQFITSTTSNFYPTSTDIFNVGFSKSNNNRLTVPAAGKYYVAAQQLVNTTGTGCYFQIQKNGTTVNYAYSNSDDTYDVVVSAVIDCAANDYIEIYYSGSITYGWSDAHSRYNVFKVS